MFGSICWYCYWGWAEPVSAIYDEYEDRCDLEFGRGHVVWSDENFGTSTIESCLRDEFKGDDPTDDALVIESLQKLLAIPESVRCCEPADYDGRNPANFPPTIPVRQRK